MTEGRRAAILGALVIALPALALVANLPAYPQILAVLNDAAHAPVFGALAIVWLLLLNRFITAASWQQYVGAFALTVAMGACIELIQPVLGRGAEWLDLMNDALGAVAGLAVCRAFSSYDRRWLWMSAAALVPVLWPVTAVSIAYVSRANEFPTLIGDDTPSDRYFIHSRGVDVTVAPLPAQWARTVDPKSLRIRITGHRWPGIAHGEPQPDWSGYTRLTLDMTNPDARPLMLTLRVHDRGHDNQMEDRFNKSLEIEGGQRVQMIIPLAEIAAGPQGRKLDLTRIAGLMLFADGRSGLTGREYYVTRVWLD